MSTRRVRATGARLDGDSGEQRCRQAEQQDHPIRADAGDRRRARRWATGRPPFARPRPPTITPSTPPAQAMNSVSESTCRASRLRWAPSAMQTERSCWRPAARARNRLARLAQPSTSRTPTMPRCDLHRRAVPIAELRETRPRRRQGQRAEGPSPRLRRHAVASLGQVMLERGLEPGGRRIAGDARRQPHEQRARFPERLLLVRRPVESSRRRAGRPAGRRTPDRSRPRWCAAGRR